MNDNLNQAVVTEWDDAHSDRFIMIFDDVWELIKGSNDISIYMALKRRVHADNGEWFSTRKALAEEAGVSEKTFDRCIKSLESKGLVQSIPRYVPKGWSKNPQEVSLIRDDAHPIQIGNIYRIRFRAPGNFDPTLSSKRPDPLPKNDQTPSSKLGNRHITQDIDTKDIDKPPIVPQRGRQNYPADFEEFWTAFPRRVGKRIAHRAWLKAVERTSVEEVLAGAQRFATDPNLPEERFIPHPTTWLNRDGWLDTPMPVQENAQKSVDDVLTEWGYADAQDGYFIDGEVVEGDIDD